MLQSCQTQTQTQMQDAAGCEVAAVPELPAAMLDVAEEPAPADPDGDAFAELPEDPPAPPAPPDEPPALSIHDPLPLGILNQH